MQTRFKSIFNIFTLIALLASLLSPLSVTPAYAVDNIVYVKTTGGVDSNTCGQTPASACKTIQKGINNAASLHWNNVYVAGGDYDKFYMLSGISVSGGYDQSFVFGGTDGVKLVRVMPASNAQPSSATGIVATGIYSPTTIANLTVIGANAITPNEASVAVTVSNSNSALTFQNVIIFAGNGANGAKGTDGTRSWIVGQYEYQTQAAGNGAKGTAGDSNSVCNDESPAGGAGGVAFPGGLTGGAGGGGGTSDEDCTAGFFGDLTGLSDSASQRGSKGGGTWGGYAGGNQVYKCYDNNSRTNGGNGGGGALLADSKNGAGGAGGVGFLGKFVNGKWTSELTDGWGGSGLPGDPGKPGGGGGGGGGADCYPFDPTAGTDGGGGGGGGAGGASGTPGGPGAAGGASIAILLVDASPNLSGVQLNLGKGGNGGNGGNAVYGQRGGYGGKGALGGGSTYHYGGKGGNGGDGKRGGHSGGGGGGAGGPSIGLFLSGTSMPSGTPTYSGGVVGVGGYGGGDPQYLLPADVKGKDGALGLKANVNDSALLPQVLMVNVSSDENDGSCADGDCSLRDAILKANLTVTPDTIRFSGNRTITLSGSGLPLITHDLTIDGGTNVVILDGAGLYSVLSLSPAITLNVNSLTIQNANGSAGSAIHNNQATLNVTNSTFIGNYASANGGAIDHTNATTNISNSTFSGNSAAIKGGAVYGYASGSLTITNSTFSGNTAPNGAGVASFSAMGFLTLINSIIANSTGTDCYSGNTFMLDQNNVIENSGPGACGFVNGKNGNIIGVDPKLAALANNGGPTQTFALLTGSRAINQGDSFRCSYAPVGEKDQTGSARGASCDIGAYELPDAVKPAASLDTKPTDPSIGSAAAFTFSATDNFTVAPNFHFTCDLDGVSTDCDSGSKNYTGLSGGAHTFIVSAYDDAENFDSKTYNWIVELDTTYPTTTILSQPAGNTSSTTATVTFTGADNLTTVENLTFLCRSPDKNYYDWYECTSPQNYTALEDGYHYLKVMAVDEAGYADYDNAAYAGWTVELPLPDTEAPSASIFAKPTQFTASASATFEFTGLDDVSPPANLIFQCQLDVAAWETCTSAKTYSGLSSALHTFKVRAIDAANNTGISQDYDWTISPDTTKPNTSIDSSPDANSLVDSATFTFSGTDNVTAPGNLAFVCYTRHHGLTWYPCTSPQVFTGLTNNKTHAFFVYAVDQAGNIDSPDYAHYSWAVNIPPSDSTPPTVSIDEKPAAFTNSDSATFAFSAFDDVSAPASLTFECQLDGAAWETSCVSPKTYNSLSNALHTFKVRASDAVPNISASVDYSWTVSTDTTKPVTSLDSQPANPSTSATATFTFSGTDNVSAPANLTFQCNSPDVGPNWYACTSPQVFNALSNDTHQFAVFAVDEAGNQEYPDMAFYSWVVDVDTTAPVTFIDSQPRVYSKSASATFTFSGQDNVTAPASLTFQCKLDIGTWAACTSPKTYTGLPDGLHNLRVRATDQAGNVDAVTALYAWEVDTVAATATILTHPTDPSNSNTATFTFSASEEATFFCSLDSGSGNIFDCSSPLILSGLADGPHNFQVYPEDRASNVDTGAEYTWTINTVPPDTSAPETTINSQPADPSASDSATFTFSASETSTFLCNLDIWSGWQSCTSPYKISDLANGSYTFSVLATDAADNADATPANYAWVVNVPPPDSVKPDTFIDTFAENPSNSKSATFTFHGTDNVTAPEDLTFHCYSPDAQVGWFECSSPLTVTDLSDGAHEFSVYAGDETGNLDFDISLPDNGTAYHTWTVDTASATFTVNKFDDANDGTCDVNDCTLREAIGAANATIIADTIIVPAGTYTLTILGATENLNATGDLDIRHDLTIIGAGAGNTIIQGSTCNPVTLIDSVTQATNCTPTDDRVLNVTGPYIVDITDVTIANGRCFGCSGGGIANDNGLVNPGVPGGGGVLTVKNSVFSSNKATNGGAGGGIYNVYSTLSVIGSSFVGNSAPNSGGGGIDNGPQGGILTIANSTFADNSVGGNGGGLEAYGNMVNVTNSTFSGNSAGIHGGAIWTDYGATIDLKNSILANSLNGKEDCYSWNDEGLATNTDNLIETNGGSGHSCGTPAVSADPNLGVLSGSIPAFTPNLSSPAVDAGDDLVCAAEPVNNASQNGITRPQGGQCDIGSIEMSPVQSGPDFNVNVTADTDDGVCNLLGQGTGNKDCTLREAITAANNHAGADTIRFAGDFTILISSTLPDMLSDMTIDGENHSIVIDGAGSHSLMTIDNNSSISLNQLTIQNGNSADYGGGILINSGTVTISKSNFLTNTAATYGGGIVNFGTLTVSRSLFQNNSAAASYGGAITNAGTITVSNSTFSGNTAGTDGGGIFGYGTMAIKNSTFSGNSGGFYNYGSTSVTLLNNIFANSSGADCVSGATITAANNLIMDTGADACDLTNGVDGNLIGLNPDLGDLTGSPAYFPLNNGSPAMNAGDNAACAAAPVSNASQNGVTRPQSGQCDIGSYEVHPTQSAAALIVNSLADTDDGDCSLLGQGTGNHDCTLREAIIAANDLAGANTITFADALGAATITLGADLAYITDESLLTINGGGDITVSGNNLHRPFHVSSDAAFTINNLTIINGFGGSASGNYGGALLNNGGDVIITNSTFKDSAAWGSGAIDNSNGTLVITNSTLANNTASGSDGGAIYNYNSALTIYNSTLSGNSATVGDGGGIYNVIATTQLYNTILANSGHGGDCYLSSGTVDGDHNLIETDSAGGNACGTTEPIHSDPQLGALMGSPAYFPLNGGSPAINAGDDAICADAPVNNASQNGVTRPNSAHCDIGSYELIQFSISGNAGIAGATLTYTDGTTRTATADGNGNYSFLVSYNWSGAVTPSKTDYAFLPVNKNYVNVLADQTAQNYTAAMMRLNFYSTPANDGWTLESSEISNLASTLSASGKLRVGDDARRKQFRSLLSFDTASIPDKAIISRVILKIYKSGTTGPDPFNLLGNLVADIKKGFFGSSPLELGDFDAAAEPVNLGKFVPIGGGWYQLTLSSFNFKYVNVFNATQFRIRFVKDDNNDKTANIALFDSGGDANPPQLIIEYSVP